MPDVYLRAIEELTKGIAIHDSVLLAARAVRDCVTVNVAVPKEAIQLTPAAVPWHSVPLLASAVGAFIGGLTALAVALIMSGRESKERRDLIETVVKDELSVSVPVLSVLISPVRHGRPIIDGPVRMIISARLRYEKLEHLMMYLRPGRLRHDVGVYFRKQEFLERDLMNYVPNNNPNSQRIRRLARQKTARVMIEVIRSAEWIGLRLGRKISRSPNTPHFELPRGWLRRKLALWRAYRDIRAARAKMSR